MQGTKAGPDASLQLLTKLEHRSSNRFLENLSKFGNFMLFYAIFNTLYQVILRAIGQDPTSSQKFTYD